MMRDAAIAIAFALLAAPAAAHPHMFVDARSTLLVDEEGRLTGVRSALIVDVLTTQYVLEEFEISPDATLSVADQNLIAGSMVEGLREYDFYTEVLSDGDAVAFSDARISQVQLQDDTLAVALDLTLSEPLALRDGASIEIALFDPTFFADVDTVAPPLMPEALAGCDLAFAPFEPRSMDAFALLELSRLTREETPEDPRVGARFADRSRIVCGG